MRKDQKLTLNEAWILAVKSISGRTNQLGKELAAANEQFPELVASFRVLVGYAAFRANQSAFASAMNKLNGNFSYIPDPLGPEPLPEFIQQMCKNPDPITQQFCRCLNGDPTACPDEEASGGRPSFDSVSPCPELCELYKEALMCALRYCDGKQASIDTLTREQYRDWVSCQNDIDSYWQQLHDQGCFNRMQPLNVLLEMAEVQFG